MRRASHRRAGFTLLEVMIAVGLMTVGALAIMAMQQASTRGNIEARQIGTATEITSRWVERLRRDALGWNRIGTSAAELGPAGTLSQMAAVGGTATTTGWFRAPAPALGQVIGPGFDWTGRPVIAAANAADIRYCTYVRLTWVRTGVLMRADVLTWWHRRGAGGDPSISNPAAFTCLTTDPATVTADIDSVETVLKSVRGSTLLRWTPR
jgi:prepilin-type N-terminal cleavage/methylation domain-containing protein